MLSGARQSLAPFFKCVASKKFGEPLLLYIENRRVGQKYRSGLSSGLPKFIFVGSVKVQRFIKNFYSGLARVHEYQILGIRVKI